MSHCPNITFSNLSPSDVEAALTIEQEGWHFAAASLRRLLTLGQVIQRMRQPVYRHFGILKSCYLLHESNIYLVLGNRKLGTFS